MAIVQSKKDRIMTVKLVIVHLGSIENTEKVILNVELVTTTELEVLADMKGKIVKCLLVVSNVITVLTQRLAAVNSVTHQIELKITLQQHINSHNLKHI